MKWAERVKLWWVTSRLPHRARRLQHDQAVEAGGIVDEVRTRRRLITHDLADKVLELDAVTDQLDEIRGDEHETDPRPDP